MMQSYYISLYLDCPRHAGLNCPTNAEVSEFETAVAAGEITWHAFPHNAELEAGTAEVIAAGLEVTHRLDKKFGLPPKATLSQRDVPGLTRSMIPLLVSKGVRAISVGVNGASMYPRVPSIFRWRDPLSKQELIANWHPRGYGGYGRADAVKVPGFAEALVTDWNSDNLGPYSAHDYVEHFRAIQLEFPGARIVGSTFDKYIAALESSGAAVNLPVLTQEIGDTWIYGDPSDPRKSAAMRGLHRAWGGYVEQGGDVNDPVYLNATRFMIKNIEHTWGQHEHGLDYSAANWTNAGFEKLRSKAGYGNMESSWAEQRTVGIAWVREALGLPNVSGAPGPARDSEALVKTLHPLAALVQAELDNYETAAAPPYTATGASPMRMGYSKVVDPRRWAGLNARGTVVAFDAETGAMNRLSRAGIEWATTERRLLELDYRVYSAADFDGQL